MSTQWQTVCAFTIPALVASFDKPTPAPFNASQTLARMGALTQSDVVPALTKALGTGGAPAQTWAAVTLGQSGSKDGAVISALQGLAQSRNPQVQYAAQQSLVQLVGT